MNICFMNTARGWGGGEKWHLEMSFELSRKGHQTFLVTNKNSVLSKKAVSCDLSLYVLKISNFSFINPYKLYVLFKFFKRNHIHSIVLNLPNDLKVGGLAARLAGVKRIIYRRGSAIPVSNSISNRLLFRKVVSGIIANSLETKNTILQNNHKLIHPDRIKIIYNGLVFPDNRVYQQNGRQKIVFGNLGRMVEQKGQETLIEVAQLLKQKLPDFKIVIAGDGPLKASLMKLAAEKDLSDYIEFPGFIEDTWGYMKTIDIFLFPSRWEGFGYVIIEAMACGKPVVAFNVSSNPELIKDGFNGYLIEPGNNRDFAEKARLLASNSDLTYTLGMNGKSFAENNFRLSKTVNEVEDFILSESSE